MVVDASGVYVAATGNGGNVTAFDPSTGRQLWLAGTDGNTQALALYNGLVYVGGHFDNYCGANAGSNHCRAWPPAPTYSRSTSTPAR